MADFEYKQFNPSVDTDPFTESKGYVEPSGEEEVRKQFSYPLKELRDYLNSLIEAGSGISIARGQNGEWIISNPLTPTGEVSQEYVDQQDGLTLQEAKAYTDTHSSIYIGDDTPEEEVVTTLFQDAEKTKAVYPRTKFSAITDQDGNPLGSVATLNMEDVSEVGEVNLIAGYDGNEDSAILKNVNGVQVLPQASLNGIDVNNVLASYSNASIDYTATEDCIVWITVDSSMATPTIDGYVFPHYTFFDYSQIYLKKGQNIKTTLSSTGKAIVFGIRR